MLPLCAGSLLSVDMSKRAVRSGQTKPSEVLKLIRKGVDVHSIEGLHAKVFVAGSEAFIGSANASAHSKTTLVEAVLRTERRSVITQARRFVESLRGQLVGPEEAKAMQKLWRPPRFFVRKPSQVPKPSPLRFRLWLVSVDAEQLDEDETRERAAGRRIARKRLRSSRLFTVDEFFCACSGLSKRLQLGDRVVQIIREDTRQVMVAPPSAVVAIRRFQTKSGRRAAVYLEAPKDRRRKSLKRVRQRLGRVSSELTRLDRSGKDKRCRDPRLAHALLTLWPSVANQDGR